MWAYVVFFLVNPEVKLHECNNQSELARDAKLDTDPMLTHEACEDAAQAAAVLANALVTALARLPASPTGRVLHLAPLKSCNSTPPSPTAQVGQTGLLSRSSSSTGHSSGIRDTDSGKNSIFASKVASKLRDSASSETGRSPLEFESFTFGKRNYASRVSEEATSESSYDAVGEDTQRVQYLIVG